MDVREKLIELLHASPHLDVVKGYKGNDCTFGQGADWLIANGVTVQKWIPLSEQKPDRDDLVIVFFEGMKDTPAAIQIIHGWCICGSASHWMPLPEPPKEV